MHMMWCIILLLVLVEKTYGYDCPESAVLRVKETHWARCNTENDRKMEEIGLKLRTLTRNQKLQQVCCVLSDTITCWVDTLRSECGNDIANDFMKTAVFKGYCASWTYLESISRSHLSYTKEEIKSTKLSYINEGTILTTSRYSMWWFITVVAILVLSLLPL